MTRCWLSKIALGLALSTLGCIPIPGLAGLGGHSSSSKSETSRTEESVRVNGQEVGDDGDDRRPAAKKSGGGADFGGTCTHNSDCVSNTCFVGSGDLGYCTKMCDSGLDCPLSWDCKHVGNAPQSICQQEH